MFKRIRLYVLLALIILAVTVPAFLFWDVQNAREIHKGSSGGINEYTIKAELDSDNKLLRVNQNIKYINNENVELEELYFHLYTNAFKEQETAPFLFDDFDRAYRSGFAPGFTELASVELLSNEDRFGLDYELQGEGSTILKIRLPESLAPGKAVELKLQYTIQIPPAYERFGYGSKCFNLGNWYPIAAVYDESGWNLDKYYAIGDPFYSDASNYTVDIDVPMDYIVAASGKMLETNEKDGKKIWSFRGEKMRDFAFVASNSFEVVEEKVGSTIVKSYFFPEDAERGAHALKFAVDSIKVYNDAFGKYPYPTYSVVETQFPTGMEYPGLVYIGEELYKEGTRLDIFAITVIHETAHQWWYGVVGNDQIDEAWLDEAFATFSEIVYLEKRYGKEMADSFISSIEESTQGALSRKAFDGRILKSLENFSTWEDYGPAVYDAGALVLCDLRNTIGEKTFQKAMREYYGEFKFKIATTKDFIEICERVSGKQLNELFDKWLGVE